MKSLAHIGRSHRLGRQTPESHGSLDVLAGHQAPDVPLESLGGFALGWPACADEFPSKARRRLDASRTKGALEKPKPQWQTRGRFEPDLR